MLSTLQVRAAAGLAAAWDVLATVDADDVDRYRAATAPLVLATRQATANTAASLYATLLRTELTPIDALAVPVPDKLRAPFTATWHALAQGRPYEEARIVGRSVAQATGDDLVTSTARRSGDQYTAATGQQITWTREPSQGACDWCMERAGGEYSTAEAADYGHERCSCLVVPI